MHKGGTVTNALRMGKEGGAIMMKEYISLVGFILTIFIVGFPVAKLVENSEIFLGRKEAEQNKNTNNHDRH